MNSLFLALIGVGMIAAGFAFYSKFLASRVFKLSDEYVTPAHTMEDGVDFVPTNKYVLWGHHFTSVAGAAPIIGPAVAIIWGWLPAFLWVTLGTVFFAGMHDFGALWASLRHRGQSIGTLSGRYIGTRGRNLFLVVIFLLLLMVNAAFATVISRLLVSTPTAVIPTWGAILVALCVGQAIYRFKWSLPVVSVVGVVALYSLMLLGERFPISLPETVWGIPANAVWILALFIYAFCASLLPVWVLLQPRDYINGLQLFIGLIILYASILITHPEVVAPAVNHNVPDGTPGMFPLLFVTVACGAISGFHGIVSSGTSSKQLDKETDARFVGYFGAVGEGLLALGTIIATSAGFKTLANWEEVYSEWSAGGVGAFISGGGSIINEGLGLPVSLAATVLATMAILFAATTMDSSVRLQRLVIEEIAQLLGFRVTGLVATIITVVLALLLTFSSGADGSGGMLLWPVFGTTNQLMAALSLSVMAVILIRLRRPSLPIVIPLVFVTVVSLGSAFILLGTLWQARNWLLLGIDAAIITATIWVIVEALVAIGRARNAPALVFDDQPSDPAPVA
ncbi:carbon starvation protein CstA [Corynebacterium phocae]|uniref:Carbon starvation protein CstA n=1 Tax=Corynebacterium phocae TaxID=161895 RepID=A0A1L7D1J2_9CORY|nr:carbon starvation protein A [Corynebacterium phocae]APT91892.1 carbon starvation protein CstA [Corynebacterium phocae]KAA8727393.1 carbon starvation protein A [Corynebacterium phocae]